MNKILIEHGKRKEIAKAFGVSGAAVTLALHGLRTGDLSRKIRHVAKTQYNGVELIPNNNQKTVSNENN
jgi:predicted transcriptional regulator